MAAACAPINIEIKIDPKLGEINDRYLVLSGIARTRIIIQATPSRGVHQSAGRASTAQDTIDLDIGALLHG